MLKIEKFFMLIELCASEAHYVQTDHFYKCVKSFLSRKNNSNGALRNYIRISSLTIDVCESIVISEQVKRIYTRDFRHVFVRGILCGKKKPVMLFCAIKAKFSKVFFGNLYI